MLRTIKVLLKPDGSVQLLEPVQLGTPRQALLTILEDGDEEALLLSEAVLSEDWLRPEEDAAWAFLQQVR